MACSSEHHQQQHTVAVAVALLVLVRDCCWCYFVVAHVAVHVRCYCSEHCYGLLQQQRCCSSSVVLLMDGMRR